LGQEIVRKMKYDYQTSLSKTLTTNKIRKHYIIASTIKTNYQNIATGYIYDKNNITKHCYYNMHNVSFKSPTSSAYCLEINCEIENPRHS
jgi:hypothetical protein